MRCERNTGDTYKLTNKTATKINRNVHKIK